MRFTISFLALGAFLTACKSGSDIGELDVLGGGSHDVSGTMEIIADDGDGLDWTMDLAFNPEADEMWVVNKRDDSVTILDAPGTSEQVSEHIVDPYALHFMEKVTSIAFGQAGTFATCQDGRNTYNNQAAPNDFTGPTLWSSDRAIFGISNPEAIDYLTDLFGFPTDLGSHLDMLHESPQCMGIDWERDNVYWVFDGFHGSINRYDFALDHGVGYDDHCDGDIQRWEVGVERVSGVVSHVALDRASGLLYIADTGNGRIAVLDTQSGQRGSNLPSVEDGACGGNGPEHYTWEGGVMTDLVTGLNQPAGIALVDDVLFVTEHGTGYIHAFDLEGNTLDWADTGRGPGVLQGIEAPSLDELWVVDSSADEVLRILP